MKVWPGAKLPRRSKYGNHWVPCEQGGVAHRHQSARERGRCFVLHQRLAAGEIRNLERQRPFRLEVQGELVATYVADFVYGEGLEIVVEDAKGYRTREYLMKKRLMRALYEIDIRET